jgi:hypothetical protein
MTSDKDRHAAHQFNRDRALWGCATADEAGSGESLRARIRPLRERRALQMKNGSRELAAVQMRAVIQPGKPVTKSSEKRIDLQKSPQRDRGTRKPELTGQNIQRREYQWQNQNLHAEENQREPTALITKRQNLVGAVFVRSNNRKKKSKA